MFQEAGRAFAGEKVRPAALEADAERATPPELLAQAAELGVNMLGVPEELGGVMHEQAAVTSVLIGEALAHGDMGIAYAALAPGRRRDRDRPLGQRRAGGDLPARLHRRGRRPPPRSRSSSRARSSTRSQLETKARRDGEDWVLDGAKSLLAARRGVRAVRGRRRGRGHRAGAVRGRVRRRGPPVEDEPAMGLRAAATGRLMLEGVRVPADALLGEGSPGLRRVRQRSRIAWCALAVGTAQAVLDYVDPLRQRARPPSANRSPTARGSPSPSPTSGSSWTACGWPPTAPPSRADHGEEFAREAALARRLCAAKGMRIGSDGVQLLGGHGFVKEHPVERWYRDLRAAGVMEGALLV